MFRRSASLTVIIKAPGCFTDHPIRDLGCRWHVLAADERPLNYQPGAVSEAPRSCRRHREHPETSPLYLP